MSEKSFNEVERQRLISAYWESRRQTSWPIFDTLTSEQIRNHYGEQDRLLKEYAERLPFVEISRCPICDAVLEYVVDTMGLDGPWWAKGDLVEFPKPQGCEHFRVLLGAIDFHGRTPSEAAVHRTVLPGPGAPFVVPRLLEIPGMRAVIWSFGLPKGDLCYPIAYFSEEPLHGAFLHQPWGREAYQVFNIEGEYEGWTIANDPWEFEPRPWIDRGLLFWIKPGDESLTLRREGSCPYENLAGIRKPQVIRKGKLSTLSLPTGERLRIFEKD